jgi:hypothetical protein
LNINNILYTLSNGPEDPIVIILTFKIRARSRPNGNMPNIRGRLLSNQDVQGIERKHSPKKEPNLISEPGLG